MKIFTKSQRLLVLLFFCGGIFGYGQVVIEEIDFETNLDGYSHTPSQTPATDPGDQYFHRAEPSDGAIYEGTSGPYTGVTDSWLFVGSNPNTINGGSPGILTIAPIDVTGFSNLELSADFGAVPNDWDTGDDLRVEYNFDGGSWNTLYSFSSSGTNSPLALTGNATGGSNTANGTVLTFALGTIVSDNFSGTGTNLNIRIVCDSDANYEAFGVDNIVLRGTSGASCNITSISITSSTACGDNGTSEDATDDFFLADVEVTFANPPASGNLVLSNSDGTLATLPIAASPMTFSTVTLPANGVDVELTATFSDEMTCTSTETIAGSAVDACSVDALCTDVLTDDFDDGNLNGWQNTGDWTNDGNELKHDLSGVVGESYIYANLGDVDLSAADSEWSFSLRNGSWDPSSSNKFWVYLLANATNFASSSTIDGYAVGVNFVGTSDLLTLYKVTNGSATALVTSALNWDSGDDIAIRVTRNAAGSWTLYYDDGGGEANAGSTTDNTYTSGNFFGLDFTYSSSRAGLLWMDDVNVCVSSVLPVSLTSLKATNKDGKAYLTFTTATEQNNSHFLIQRSTDEGKTFATIGQLAGQGDSNEAVNYEFVDDQPLAGLNYYCIHQFDFDGSNERFGPVAVRFGSEDGDRPAIWPVPATDRLQVKLPAAEADWMLEVFDLNGRRLLAEKIAGKSINASLDLQTLPAGGYVLRWNTGAHSGQQRFVKL